MPYLEIEKKGNVAWITLNNPDTLNALNRAAHEEISQAVDDLEADPDIQVAVLTGAGKAFVAGADITEMVNMSGDEARDFSDFGHSVFIKLEKSPIVSIAAVNGFALGGGMELTMACDLRIASTKAKMGQPELNLGVTPGFGGTQRLARLVGIGRAKEMLFTGEMIDAETAKEYGLVMAVYEPDELLDEAAKLAEKILSMGPTSLRLVKKAIDEGYGRDIVEGCSIEADAFGECFASGDAKKGMTAFLEKRKAEW
ncbi:MAG: enoyl-CoA hydratase/isomerase family protein [Candidatus Coatesbacteria bacterium]|nr:MAG: enoyl-CoA hydratase/isomerase family protein [Candidatus Coatesbacteria bacterium]